MKIHCLTHLVLVVEKQRKQPLACFALERLGFLWPTFMHDKIEDCIYVFN